MSSPDPKSLLIATYGLNAWVLFYARAVVDAGHLAVTSAPLRVLESDADHNDCLKYLPHSQALNVVDEAQMLDLEPSNPDVTMISISSHATSRERGMLSRFLSHGRRRIVLLKCGDSSFVHLLKLLLKELRQPILQLADLVLVEDSRVLSTAVSRIAPMATVGIVPHQRTICAEGAMQPLTADGARVREREILFNFQGTYAEPRIGLIDRLEKSIVALNGNGRGKWKRAGGRTVIWHADRPGTNRRRAADDYQRNLYASEFTLALPGSVPWTHRVLEAIWAGSIPVIAASEVGNYELPLRHMENCVLVRGNQWEDAANSLSSLPRSAVARMQDGVEQLRCGPASCVELRAKALRRLGFN